ncbi:MAG TPA: ABC transporter ATP-binding protein [Candidatus Limnocylindria bacterium]|nr:ABC transporter ATP-binding protein [Candidatus Limnocylindria bacterium]
MTPAVRAQQLTKRYGSSLAVAGVDLEVAPGEIFGLVGPNGAGKTTMLKMLATLLVPSAGDAQVAGRSVRREPDAVRSVIGYMPDTFGVYDDMRVWEYLDFFGRCYGLSAARRRQMIGDLLELVDLAHKRQAYVQELSRGMQQRLCLAHALVHDPQVLLLDEPASGLDPRARVELRELLRELRTLGKAIIISSHILPELEELCSSVAIIDHGRLLASGRVEDIQQRFRSGGVYRARVLGPDDELGRAESLFAEQSSVASVVRRPDGELELALRGDDDAAAAVLAAAVQAGVRLASYAPAASDLEELFLQITEVEHAPVQQTAADA